LYKNIPRRHLVSRVGDAATRDPKLVIVLVDATDGSTGIIRGDSSPFIPKRPVIPGLSAQPSEAETKDASVAPSMPSCPEPRKVKPIWFKFGY